ncbi:MAG: fructose 1,6-bisphosphatase [Candidatus Aenigmarchaeota archaeon]|nr:fructose 1,6-bisphosphatase [Candidatus Aenigmarchaeota archaeon]
MKITLSAIKADIGGVGGHTKPSDELVDTVRKIVSESKLPTDSYVGYTGDDIHILMSHDKGIGSSEIHKLAFDAFMEGTEVAKSQGLYGAGQDLLKTSFSGNVKGMGPGVAEMQFEERPNEAFVLLTADKTEPGAFNFPFYRVFCEPSANTGLLLNPTLSKGVTFRIMDVMDGTIAELRTPEDIFMIAAVLMYPGRYVVESVWTKDNEPVLAATTDRLHNIAGTYVGKDDPAALVRLQKNFPATEEFCSVFKVAHYVAGNTRGSHHVPLMPVKRNSPASTNFCIPLVSCSLFSMHNGMFTGPFDAFETPDWDYYRKRATKKADFMREQGFVHPATLIPEELEYNKGYQAIMDQVRQRFR